MYSFVTIDIKNNLSLYYKESYKWKFKKGNIMKTIKEIKKEISHCLFELSKLGINEIPTTKKEMTNNELINHHINTINTLNWILNINQDNSSQIQYEEFIPDFKFIYTKPSKPIPIILTVIKKPSSEFLSKNNCFYAIDENNKRYTFVSYPNKFQHNWKKAKRLNNV